HQGVGDGDPLEILPAPGIHPYERHPDDLVARRNDPADTSTGERRVLRKRRGEILRRRGPAVRAYRLREAEVDPEVRRSRPREVEVAQLAGNAGSQLQHEA